MCCGDVWFMIMNTRWWRMNLGNWIFRSSVWKAIITKKMWNSSASGWRHFRKFWIRESMERGLLQYERKKNWYGSCVCRVRVLIGVCLFCKRFCAVWFSYECYGLQLFPDARWKTTVGRYIRVVCLWLFGPDAPIWPGWGNRIGQPDGL